MTTRSRSWGVPGASGPLYRQTRSAKTSRRSSGQRADGRALQIANSSKLVPRAQTISAAANSSPMSLTIAQVACYDYPLKAKKVLP